MCVPHMRLVINEFHDEAKIRLTCEHARKSTDWMPLEAAVDLAICMAAGRGMYDQLVNGRLRHEPSRPGLRR